MAGALEAPSSPDGDVQLAPRERRTLEVLVKGRAILVSLTRVQDTWLASAKTVEGATLGADHSPYLAVSEALEPLGGQLIDVLGTAREVSLE